MSMFPTDNPLKLRLELSRVEAALATSQADVTRLAAELAESVRALAVSQGEVADAKRKMSLVKPTFRCGDMSNGENGGDRVRCCGGAPISLHENDDDAPMGYRCYDCKTVFCRVCAPLHFTEEFRATRARAAAATEVMHLWLAAYGVYCDGRAFVAQSKFINAANLARAFLATPTASPEPDRASPEVTVKENDHE